MSNLLYGNIAIQKDTGGELLLDFIRESKNEYCIEMLETECTISGHPAVVIQLKTWLSYAKDFADALEDFLSENLESSKFDGDVISVLLTHDYGTIEVGSFGSPYKSGDIEYAEELEYDAESKSRCDYKIMASVFNIECIRKYDKILEDLNKD